MTDNLLKGKCVQFHVVTFNKLKPKIPSLRLTTDYTSKTVGSYESLQDTDASKYVVKSARPNLNLIDKAKELLNYIEIPSLVQGLKL